jgi:hypothetical protein
MVKFVTHHTVQDGSALSGVLLDILRFQTKIALSATALTDSSTGAVSGTRAIAAVAAAAVSTANAGTNLADKTTTEAAMTTVLNGLATLHAKAATAVALIGVTAITNNGGGASGGNTVAAVTKSVTATATGVPAAAWNTFTAAVAGSFYQVGRQVNQLCSATGQLPLDLSALKGTLVNSTVAAISTATGAATDPGTTKARVDADLTVMANNIATIAARINACISGTNTLNAVAAPWIL